MFLGYLVGSFPESCSLEVSPTPSIDTASVVERSLMPFVEVKRGLIDTSLGKTLCRFSQP